jgi:DNA polymerase III delta prime subunit
LPPKKRPVKKKPAVKKTTQTPHNIFLYGKAGTGKTSLAGRFPRSLFLRPPDDRGCTVLALKGLIPQPVDVVMCDCWEILSGQYGQITGQHPVMRTIPGITTRYDFDTLVIDSLTGFERMCFEYVTLKDFRGKETEFDKGFYSYGQGPIKTAAREWPQFLLSLSEIVELGKTVVVIGHRTKVSVEYPGQPRFDRWQPLLNKHIWERTQAWSEAIFYMEDGFDVIKEPGSLQSKAAADMNGKLLYTRESPRFDAKNQLNMEPVINLGITADQAWETLKVWL